MKLRAHIGEGYAWLQGGSVTPAFFHLPSALMQRESRQSPRFLEMWQSIMFFSALVLFDYLLSPMKPQPLVRRRRSGGMWGWGGSGCDGYLCLM